MKKFIKSFFFVMWVFFTASAYAKTDRTAEFQTAIQKDDIKKIEKLIKKSTNEEKNTALIYAVTSGKKESVQTFLNAGMDINTTDNEQNTLLHIACKQSNNTEIVQLLLDKGVPVNIRNGLAKTPLMVACETPNNSDTIKTLVTHNADINATRTGYGKTPLMFAAQFSTSSVVKFLIDNGANINEKSTNDETALMFAVRANNLSTVKLLIESGANINAKNVNGETVLFYVIKGNNPQLAESLLENKIDINSADNDGKTPLMLAVEFKNQEMVSLLLNKNAKINALDKEKHSALYYAIQNNDIEMVRLLLTNKADMYIAGDKGLSLEKQANEEILNIMMQYGYKPAPNELWNGFTDEMTKEQVIARADKILNTKSRDITRYFNRDDNFGIFYHGLDSNTSFPYADTIISYTTPRSEFDEFGDYGNVKFYFYTNTLVAVHLYWNTDLGESVRQKAIENYGNGYQSKIDHFPDNMLTGQYHDNRFTRWDFGKKDICLREENISHYREIAMLFLSKPNVEKQRKRIQVQQEQQQRQKETERQRKINNITF